MVYASASAETRAMCLEEYIDFVHAEVDVYDFDSIAETSWALAALANDRDFLLQHYHRELKDRLTQHSTDAFSAQSIRLHAGRDFYIRANIWPAALAGPDREERTLFSYEVPHNHNFHFCSVGYFGPGYETDLFRCEKPNDILGYVGEAVALERAETRTLSPGSVLAYEAFRDIHIQKVPTSTSISVNLMCRNPSLRNTQQFLFDVERDEIAGSVGTIVGNRLFLVNTCRHIHDDETVDLLTHVAVRHDCLKTRAMAASVLRDIAPSQYESFESRSDAETVRLSRMPIAYGDDMIRVGNSIA